MLQQKTEAVKDIRCSLKCPHPPPAKTWTITSSPLGYGLCNYFQKTTQERRSTRKLAGTVYPVIGMQGDTDNAVFLPGFVDSSLRIREVRYVKVEQADEALCLYMANFCIWK
jgi:hypothetical protein